MDARYLWLLIGLALGYYLMPRVVPAVRARIG